MILITSATFSGQQPKNANQKENKVKLYKVNMNVRYGKPNSEGVYGVGRGMSSGFFNVQAESTEQAREKAQKGIDGGMEPYMVSQGGYCVPSPNKTTITLVALQSGPYIP